MRVCETPNDMRIARGAMDGSVGLVPTMGALHEGHLALVRRARQENEHVVVSIFVNPTQFASDAEVDGYPRTLENDLEQARAEGVTAVFVPTADNLYPAHFSTFIDVGDVATPLEGASRPGHFRGVTTVVAKLLNIVQPTRAYFGRKDIQQLIVVRRMVADLNFPVEIVGVETVRDAAGIALSSRNLLLSPDELLAARCLNQALGAAAALWDAGERDAKTLRSTMEARIQQEPRATLDYASIADPDTIDELDGHVTGAAIASLAVHIGGVRLIDNITLENRSVANRLKDR